jgi:hypothetical protein
MGLPEKRNYELSGIVAINLGASGKPDGKTDVSRHRYKTLQKFSAITAFLKVLSLLRRKGTCLLNQDPRSVNSNMFTHTP